ncbi:hypothetical protein, partial [Pseudactinotalea sp.]|uniref:hypothetical protein n=1 Tax=Pseudactinotalea sp. TaxID=1926260 RepID=UPI003B3B7D23
TPAPPARSNNQFWQSLEERIGARFDVQIVPTGDFEQRFQTAVAGDQLPDLFTIFTGQVPSLPAVLNEKAADLTPFLSGGAIADYPFLANILTENWADTVFSGKIFGVPVPRGPQSSATFYSRQDILSEMGIDEPPASLEEFLDLCRELNSPSSNVWALGQVPLTYLRQMFGVPNQWSLEDGALVRSYEADGQEEALEAGSKLVAEGLVHPDAFGAPGSDRKTWMVNGTTLLVDDSLSGWGGFYNYPTPDGFNLEIWAPPLAGGGGTAPIWLAPPTHNITAISIKAVERAPALLEFLNYLAAPFGTAEYEFKKYGDEGVHHTMDGTDPVLNDKGTSETQLSLKYLVEGPRVTYQAGFADVTQAQFDAHMSVVPTATRNPVQGLYSETNTRRAAQISLDELESDILQGRVPVSRWADGVAEWKAKGGDDIRDEFMASMEERDASA